jgi:AcrR family transcriptional regulator
MKKGIAKVGKEVRREQIKQATFNILANQGLKGLTIASIAEKVSVSEANLYRHFKNKKEILTYAVESIGDGLKQNLIKIKNMRTKNPVTKLKKLFNLHLEYIETNEGIPHLVFSQELHKGNPDMRNKLLNAIHTYASEIELLLKQGQEAGIICKEVDTHAFSFTIIGMVQISTIMWLLNNCSSSLVTDGMKQWNALEKSMTVKK